MDITLRTIPAARFCGVRRTVEAGGIGPACREILPATSKSIRAAGGRPAGAATLFHSHDREGGRMEIEVGWWVEGECPDGAEVRCTEIPALEAAVALHRGPYEQLGGAWNEVDAWIRARGREPGEPCWETYRNDPGECASPAEYETEIVWAVR